MINHVMFQRNGHSGYVLKPPVLRGLAAWTMGCSQSA